MRYIANVLLLPIMVLPMIAAGQQVKSGDKILPTDDAVIGLVGKDLAGVFSNFGVPQDVVGVNGPNGTQEAVLDYGTFGFNIQNKKVRICQFWAGWPGTVDGIKLGLPIDDVVKNLGKPLYVEKDANGAERQFWELKNIKLLIYFDVDKDRKASRAVVKPFDQPKP
jgi:hypothetical protein